MKRTKWIILLTFLYLGVLSGGCSLAGWLLTLPSDVTVPIGYITVGLLFFATWYFVVLLINIFKGGNQ